MGKRTQETEAENNGHALHCKAGILVSSALAHRNLFRPWRRKRDIHQSALIMYYSLTSNVVHDMSPMCKSRYLKVQCSDAFD